MSGIDRASRVFVAGHRGMVGSAIVRRLQAGGYGSVMTRSRAELDLLDQRAVHAAMAELRPDYRFIAAAKVKEIVEEMLEADYASAKRDSLVKQAGFQAYDYHE